MIKNIQHTLQNKTTIRDIGLHSGVEVTMNLIPAEENYGIVFVRTDLTQGDNVIPARWNNVVDTQLCTVIGNDDGAQVGTIEHLMSALRGCGVDNLIVEINGAEVPAMDGSAMPFVEAIEKVGLKAQNLPKRAIRVLKEVCVEDNGKRVTLKPDEACVFAGEIEFDHKDIGRQRFETQLVNGNFKHDIAQARTFGFLHEVEYMRSQGLGLGGSLDNAIILDTHGVINPDGLRFSNEFIRHKLLDAIGDLYLAGGHILGLYDGVKAGHAINNAILHALFSSDENWEYVDLPIAEDHSAHAVACEDAMITA
ncbi:MAG: UDP-3-O-[3-hydroxymyristoyl] N-acetylglucosamine deacetylase [Zetaproteobacteria bacterium]|nr:MAG: UDP-3-O-[3-hydroxymyristoyl] N-acetylglucosamine deacetylase [Zetaproteobacteria bacterium]